MKTVFWVLLALSLLSVAGVYYWEIRYFFGDTTPGRNELLAGAALFILYTWPFWIGLPVFALFKIRIFSSTKVIISFVPIILIFGPTIYRSISNSVQT